MSYTALYRKFRPTEFEDVKGQDHIITTLKNQIKAERIGHAYLFCGTRGTGKTTVAKIFAKARNVGMKAAHGEWFLYIDDDEWFENPEALIQFFKSGQYRKYGCVNYIQRNYYDEDFIHYDDFWASRMIKLDADTCFHSKIHEYMAPIRGEAFNLELIANHTGYIFQTPEAKRKHFDRNAPLLLEMIKEEPEREQLPPPQWRRPPQWQLPRAWRRERGG